MRKIHYLVVVVFMIVFAMPMFAQVSNDNEDGVNKVDGHFIQKYVPGQVLVKFKDDCEIRVNSNTEGRFRAASISSVDKMLKEFGVETMEKLFPSATAKPVSQLRSKRAPNGNVVKEKNLDKIFLLKMGEEKSVMKMVKQLKAMPEVEYAEPNYCAYITADVPADFGSEVPDQTKITRRVPVSTETNASTICSNPGNNPLYSSYQYGIRQQNIHQLWNKPIINKKRPVIAILDTGVDINHPDLVNNIWTNTAEAEGETAYDDDGNGIVDDIHGWDFIGDYYETPDRNGHGTHCAGIAAAVDNSIGIVGANPLALIMPVKVMKDNGAGDFATVARGIVYAAENGADIISMSLGGGVLPIVLQDALDMAYQTAILVAAAGNKGTDIYNPNGGTHYPAAYYLVLGVESNNQSGQRASFSNYDPDGPIFSEDGIDGRNYEIQVPGVDIYSTMPNGQYNKLSGTSMSTPLFAGAISALQMVKTYPSKDVLYGDLIHLKADFAKIYSNDTPRMPKIDLVEMNVDDNVSGNTNIDGQVDVGETVKFSPVLRNTWADATDITLKLTVDNLYQSFVTIANPQVAFGQSLSSYGRAIAKTPIQVTFANNIGDNTRIKFTLQVSCHEGGESFTQDVYVTVNNMVKLGGLITENRTLTADHVYFVNENIGIPEGVTLTIEPGTRLEFEVGMGLASDGKLVANGTPEKPIVFTGHNGKRWSGIWGRKAWDSSSGYQEMVPKDTISYCRIENCELFDRTTEVNPYMKDCVYTDGYCENISSLFQNLNGLRIQITDCYVENYSWYDLNYDFKRYKHSNIVNNIFGTYLYANENIVKYSMLENSNYFNNSFYNSWDVTGKYAGKHYLLGFHSSTPAINSSDTPSYLGTGREDVVRPLIYEIGNSSDTFGHVDLSNMPTSPYTEAHGIVWKVCVNGKDSQDEFEDLAPLGVGRHKFEVYFNRPMNKAVIPQVTFGVREPYNQHAVTEDGSWNADGTIYTAYTTITGKTASDGLNRICVQGAEDNEYFPIPYEKTRFNFLIGAAGSLATGFAADPKMGRVDLTWDNSNNDFDDAMGFNVYRYYEYEKLMPVFDEWGNPVYEQDAEGNDVTDEYGSPIPKMEPQIVADTLCLNKEILNIETEAYTDYNVVPGETYYYYYKVISTDLTEYDVSNVVSATPLSSVLGDANGSGDVDVADVITTVNFAAGLEPKPFIFEAADMNADSNIDILDVVGIIQKILNQSAAPVLAIAEATAIYTIEDGVLYVETPVALAGVQAQINMDGRNKTEDVKVADDLDGFEHTSAWLSDNDYLFLAYNMNGKTLPAGKHALLYVGGADLSSLRLSDTQGRNVMVEAGEGATDIDAMGSKVMKQEGIYDLQGRKLSILNFQRTTLKKGVYIINGEKVVK